MPTHDTCQPEVVRALKKDGWTIVGEQVYETRPDIGVYIDIEAAKADQDIFIEVKCFPSLSITDDFYAAIGQYLVYQEALAINKPGAKLYLAIPAHIFEKRIGPTYRDAIRHNRVKIIVVDLKTEVIERWIE